MENGYLSLKINRVLNYLTKIVHEYMSIMLCYNISGAVDLAFSFHTFLGQKKCIVYFVFRVAFFNKVINVYKASM